MSPDNYRLSNRVINKIDFSTQVEMLNVAYYLSLIFCVVSIVVLASVAPCCHNRHLPPTLPLIASSAPSSPENFFLSFLLNNVRCHRACVCPCQNHQTLDTRMIQLILQNRLRSIFMVDIYTCLIAPIITKKHFSLQNAKMLLLLLYFLFEVTRSFPEQYLLQSGNSSFCSLLLLAALN